MKKLISLLSFIFIGFAAVVNAESPVWKVTKGNHHLYLGGTIHLLGKSDYPLPPAFNTAYHEASRLVFEADMMKFQSPEYQNIFMQKISYPDDKSLKDVLNKKNLVALEKFFTDRDMPFDPMLRFKPGMLVMMLTVIEMKRLNIAGIGVDQFYINKGLKEGKKFSFLEEVDEQLAFIVDMGKDNPNELVEYTLRDMHQLATQLAAIKKAWRTGNNAELKKVALIPWKDGFPELYNTLMVKRNHKWIPKIENMLKTKEVEFVMFGALHMVGDDGVLKLLQQRGYTIQKL
ncbi:MAG: TraB/GumN family protein [Gammaproteobacteria bacterium]|nr:TraB/GumN family protein [Gammaproteobacteria bacterium]